MPKATWKPHEKHGRLTMQSDLPDSVYAFPKQRKGPLTDAQHVRNAVARDDQERGVASAAFTSGGLNSTWTGRESSGQLGIAAALAGIHPFFMNGSRTRYSSSGLLKKAQT